MPGKAAGVWSSGQDQTAPGLTGVRVRPGAASPPAVQAGTHAHTRTHDVQRHAAYVSVCSDQGRKVRFGSHRQAFSCELGTLNSK